MTIYRNQYGSDKSYAYFPTWFDAENNAQAWHPAGLLERCKEIKIPRDRKGMCRFLKEIHESIRS